MAVRIGGYLIDRLAGGKSGTALYVPNQILVFYSGKDFTDTSISDTDFSQYNTLITELEEEVENIAVHVQTVRYLIEMVRRRNKLVRKGRDASKLEARLKKRSERLRDIVIRELMVAKNLEKLAQEDDQYFSGLSNL